ncbi:MAG TPA: hypothetical protein VFO63_16345 [Blastocatellia bacterium]|nr:hypothetical protein [Blastocatellia bacterium]
MSAVLSATDTRGHVRWTMVGLVSMFSLQVIVSLIFDAIAYARSSSTTLFMQDTALVVIFGLMIGAFLIGGFIIGWKSGQRRVFDSVIAAAITVGLSFVVYLLIPQGYKAQFITGALLSDPAQAVTFLILGLIAAPVGAYWGWHVTQSEEEMLEETSISPEHRKNGKEN